MAYTISNARNKLKADKANPADYGLRSWDQANYQTLANAIGDIVVKDTYYNKGISDAVRANRILAYPGGSTDPVTKEKLTEEQTQQAAASYNKDNAIAEIKNLASEYVDTAWNSGSYTKKGMDLFKANTESKIKNLFDKVQKYGVSEGEFNSIFSQSANDRNTFQLDAFERNNKQRGGFLGFLDKATPIITNIAAGVITGGLNLGAQLAVSAANSYVQGAKGEDIIRGIIGTIAASQLGPLADGQTTGVGVVDDFNKAIQAINNPELQSAIFNAARQGTYATITEQNIAKNMAAGAIAGAIATNIQNKYKDPALANAAGEYFQAKIAGKSDLEAAAAAFAGYATEEDRKAAQKKVAEEVSSLPLDQVQALGYKTKDEITGAFFPVPAEIAAKQEFTVMPGEVGENIVQAIDKDGIVTYEKKVTAQTPLGNKIDYTILYDTDTNQFYYEYGTGEKKVLSKSRPSLTTLDASQEILPSSLVGAQTGQRKQGDDFGVSTVRQQEPPVQVDVVGFSGRETPVEEMPTISLLRRVRTGQETRQNETPLQVDVYGGAGFDREGEPAPQRLITESVQETQQEEPEAQRQENNTVLLGLLGGTGTRDFARMARTQREPNERQAASMQALSQALSVGDAGDALFGSGLGRRKNVWNVESLRLKDELGG